MDVIMGSKPSKSQSDEQVVKLCINEEKAIGSVFGVNGYVVGHQRSNSSSAAISTCTQSLLTHKRTPSLRQRIEHAEQLMHKLVTDAWKVCHFDALPKWMQDNDFLHMGHRPPLPSYWICAKSIFRMHTETGNIWTHGLGFILFVLLAIYMFGINSSHKQLTDKLMLAVYFVGAITCLMFSTVFHTCCCHSPRVSKFCSKLDYCGISAQIIGSMIPALYYGFKKQFMMYLIYISIGAILCVISITISLWDKFGEPRFRALRATVFLSFGLSNVIPGIHWFIILESHVIWSYCLFVLQGALYVVGAALYALRIPERFFPGKCDYWFQSHQIFHILVVLAAIVHLSGITGLATITALTYP